MDNVIVSQLEDYSVIGPKSIKDDESQNLDLKYLKITDKISIEKNVNTFKATQPIKKNSVFVPNINQNSRARIKEEAQIYFWDINDIDTLPENFVHFDQFDLWLDGNLKKCFYAKQHNVKHHTSGWAMRNTNNHNASILKKSCLGIFVCHKMCTNTISNSICYIRPAICEKARARQLGSPCVNQNCDGIVSHIKCSGNRGHPVTHLWRRIGDTFFFESKGYHNHPRATFRFVKRRRVNLKVNNENKEKEDLQVLNSCTLNRNQITNATRLVPIKKMTEKKIKNDSKEIKFEKNLKDFMGQPENTQFLCVETKNKLDKMWYSNDAFNERGMNNYECSQSFNQLNVIYEDPCKYTFDDLDNNLIDSYNFYEKTGIDKSLDSMKDPKRKINSNRTSPNSSSDSTVIGSKEIGYISTRPSLLQLDIDLKDICISEIRNDTFENE